MKTSEVMRTQGRTSENGLSFHPPEKGWVEETRKHLLHYLSKWPRIYLSTFCFPRNYWSLPPCHIGILKLYIVSLGRSYRLPLQHPNSLFYKINVNGRHSGYYISYIQNLMVRV